MNYFRISKNDGDDFTITEQDFIIFCEQYMTSISEKLGGINGKLPETVDDTDFMMLDEVEDLLENYFTLKFLAREYNLELPHDMETIAEFIAELLKLGVKK